MEALRQGALVIGACLVITGAAWGLARVCTLRRGAALPRTLIFWLLIQGYVVYGLWWIGALVAPSRGLALLTAVAAMVPLGIGRLARQRLVAGTWGAAIGWGVPWVLAWLLALRAR